MRPQDEAELAECLRAAEGPVAVRGGGTRGVPVAGAVLETGAMAGVVLYEPGALTLVVRAGTALAEVEAVLGAERQRLPAAGAGGGVPRRHAGGAVCHRRGRSGVERRAGDEERHRL